MKKKLVLGLLLFIALFTITGCGNNKEENKEKNKESNVSQESNNAKNKVVSTMKCSYIKESIYEKTAILNFDKDNILIDGKYTTVYSNEEDCQYEYDFITGKKNGQSYSGYDDVKINGNTLIETFTVDSPVITNLKYYMSSYSKDNLKNYHEKYDYVCE